MPFELEHFDPEALDSAASVLDLLGRVTRAAVGINSVVRALPKLSW
jgi:hypothetical protein